MSVLIVTAGTISWTVPWACFVRYHAIRIYAVLKALKTYISTMFYMNIKCQREILDIGNQVFRGFNGALLFIVYPREMDLR